MLTGASGQLVQIAAALNKSQQRFEQTAPVLCIELENRIKKAERVLLKLLIVDQRKEHAIDLNTGINLIQRRIIHCFPVEFVDTCGIYRFVQCLVSVLHSEVNAAYADTALRKALR